MADQSHEEMVIIRNSMKGSNPEYMGVRRTWDSNHGIDRTRQQQQQNRKSCGGEIPVDNVDFTASQDSLLHEGSESDPFAKLRRAVDKTCYEDCRKLLQEEGVNINSRDEIDGSTLLHNLAQISHKGDEQTLEIAKLFIQKDAQVDALDNEGNTPLHITARDGFHDFCKLLIEHANTEMPLINCLNEKKMTALHLAAKEGHSEVVHLLLRHGAKPGMKDDRAWFPIHYAMDKGSVECCQALAPSYQGDATASKRQEPLIMVAAKKGNCYACMEIPPEKLDVSYKDKEQNTALHIVAKKGFDRFVTFLLELGAPIDQINSQGYTPLMLAVAKEKPICVAALASKGASLTMKTTDQSNVLHLATQGRSNKCMSYLLNHDDVKGLINEKNKEGYTPLLLAIQKRSVQCRKLLENAGASPLAGNSDWASVLYLSPNDRGSFALEDMLLKEKDVNIINEDKWTLLHIAAQEGLADACKHLLRKGARINACEKSGKTPLHLASLNGHDNVLKILLKHGASKRARDTKKFTALHCAASGGKLESCKVLLHADRGLMREKNRRGKYPLDIAFEQGSFELFTFLLKKFSEMTRNIPDDLTKRFHSYVHKMFNDKKEDLLLEVLKSNWWEVGFGAAKGIHSHGNKVCPLFRDMIDKFPDLVYKIMTKCCTTQNYKLFEDDYYCRERSKEAKQTCEEKSNEEDKTDTEAKQTNEEASKEENKNKTKKKDTGLSIEFTDLKWKQNHPVYIMASRERSSLLFHLLIENWIAHKWKTYARRIFVILLAIRVFFISTLIAFLYTIKDFIEPNNEEEDDSFSHSLVVPPAITCLMFVSFMLQLMVDVNTWYRMRTQNISLIFVRLPGLCLFLITVILTYGCQYDCNEWIYKTGIPALLLVGLPFLFDIDKLLNGNILAGITKRFLLKYLKGIFFVSFIVLLFAFVFHLLLWRQKDGHFKSMGDSIVSVALWQFGEFDHDVFFTMPMFGVFTQCLFFFYLFTFGALIITLLKVPSNTIQENELNKQIGMINLVFDIDVCFPMLRKVCLESQFDDRSIK